jgi:thioredoxin
MQQPRDFSLHGAVDLGARQAAVQRRQRADQAPDASGDTGGSGNVIEVTDESFDTDVVARSRTVPVIMDLWAEWCGPCKQLGPVLEKLATEANGAWVLAKVDVDANPQLSAALQVQSIPMVVAWVGGQPVDAFLGAVPEPQVRGWISQILAAAEQLGLPGAGPDGGPDWQQRAGDAGDEAPGGIPADPAFSEAQDALERGDFDAAAAAFEKLLAGRPGDPLATMGLRQVELLRRVASYDQAGTRRAAAARPGDVDAQLAMADIELASGEPDAGFRRLLDVIRNTSGDERDKARRHLVSLFEMFPPRDPVVARVRATLSSLLF